MIKKLLVISTILFSLTAFGCEVHLPSELVLIGNRPNVVEGAIATGCSSQMLNEVNETLSSVDGKITSFQLSGLLKNKNYDVSIRPNLIKVQHFKNLVREQLLLPPGVQLHSSQTTESSDFLALNEGETLGVSCENCLYSVHQPIHLNISKLDGNKKTITILANFKKMVKAFRLTTFLPAFSEIPVSALKQEIVEAIPYTDLITDSEKLKFFKLNKPMRPGEILRQSDLSALSLVKAGTKTEVIIENSMVKLKTSGISRSNGTIGEYVEVFHPQKNKKYLGKVIDINKVLVEL
jgi:flagella basal body P-ring formation protein FlgA